jgi:serine/threonine-protein kinase CTR1
MATDIPVQQSGTIRRSSVIIEAIAGRGSFGVVYHGQWRGSDVAVKTLHTRESSFTNPGALSNASLELLAEAEMSAAVSRHPRIVHFCGIINDDEGVALVTAFMPRGSAAALLVGLQATLARSARSMTGLVRMCYDASGAIEHLHAQHPPVIHCDIAARNLLLDDMLRAHVGDFGFSRLLSARARHTDTPTVPFRWTAPESLISMEFNEASDVYSFGVTMYVHKARSWLEYFWCLQPPPPSLAVVGTNFCSALCHGATSPSSQSSSLCVLATARH